MRWLGLAVLGLSGCSALEDPATVVCMASTGMNIFLGLVMGWALVMLTMIFKQADRLHAAVAAKRAMSEVLRGALRQGQIGFASRPRAIQVAFNVTLRDLDIAVWSDDEFSPEERVEIQELIATALTTAGYRVPT